MSIERLAVLGAGQMGQGIAQVAAQKGIAVTLLDVDETTATRGRERIAARLGRLVDKGKLERAAADGALEKIVAAGDYARLTDADFALEAVTEKFEIKHAILKRADEALSKQAILASNTSSISLTRLAAATQRPDRVVGMHFMNPVPLMQLVEIISAMQTSEATLAATVELAEKLGKTVIRSQDRPGFIVNRMLIPFINEACFALQEGVGSAEDIDQGAVLGLNHPLGPLALADLIGLDTCLYIAEVLHQELGEDKYRPPALLRNHVAAGWLGRKSGRGFYSYDEK